MLSSILFFFTSTVRTSGAPPGRVGDGGLFPGIASRAQECWGSAPSSLDVWRRQCRDNFNFFCRTQKTQHSRDHSEAHLKLQATSLHAPASIYADCFRVVPGRAILICSAKKFSAFLFLRKSGIRLVLVWLSALPLASRARAIFCSGSNSSDPRASTSTECLAKNSQTILNPSAWVGLVFINKVGRSLADNQ